MTESFQLCAVVPTYDNPQTVRAVVAGIRAHGLEVVLVDDGSADAGREACAAIAAEGLAVLCRHERNRGKGAAVKTGLRRGRELGCTHALQIDADGQHDLACIPAFVAAARQRPEALVLGYPVYDATVPRLRLHARRLTALWVGIELGRRDAIVDALVGFRVYPLAATLAIGRTGDRMEFDVEIAVRMAMAGTPIVNLPVGIRYLRAAEGGISHFRPLRDNMRLSWLHTRICTAGCFRWLRRRLRGTAS